MVICYFYTCIQWVFRGSGFAGGYADPVVSFGELSYCCVSCTSQSTFIYRMKSTPALIPRFYYFDRSRFVLTSDRDDLSHKTSHVKHTDTRFTTWCQLCQLVTLDTPGPIRPSTLPISSSIPIPVPMFSIVNQLCQFDFSTYRYCIIIFHRLQTMLSNNLMCTARYRHIRPLLSERYSYGFLCQLFIITY